MTSVNKNPEILTNLGIGSGINTTKLIEALVNSEVEGPKAQLENREEKVLKQHNILGIVTIHLIYYLLEHAITYFS